MSTEKVINSSLLEECTINGPNFCDVFITSQQKTSLSADKSKRADSSALNLISVGVGTREMTVGYYIAVVTVYLLCGFEYLGI